MNKPRVLLNYAHNSNRFQWAACQLDSLKRCRNRKTLYKALVTLPSTLDETYDRILCSIHKDDVDYAIRILHWLAFSKRPLTVQELSEVIAIELDRRPAFDRDEVLEDKMEVLDICSSLVAIRDDLGERNIVVLAHYSVKEYLTSDRCALGPAARFKINMDFSNEFIARSCLAYLLQFQDPALLPELRQSALAQYAAQYWIAHAQAGRGQSDAMQKSIMELFSCNEVAYVNWVRIFDPDKPPNHRYPQLRLPRSYPPQPQYYAARFGLVGILKLLLNNGADVNVHGGRYGTAIHAASTLGYGEIVEVLLKYRANVKKRAKGTRCETALTAASRHGHLQIVELLLNNGADVNTQGESFSYGTALQAASRGGHVQIVDLLLNKGADVNITGGRFGNALIAASFCGYLEIAVRLIDAGANIDAADMSNDYGTALHAASRGGHLPIVELLLRRGADVNIHHGDWGTALIAASEMGQYHIVQILVNHGVNVNLQSKRMGTALQVTAERGQIQIARLLLSKGAEVNGEVLCSASRGGHLQLVELLLNNHAKIDAYGQNGTALVVASRNGHLDVVELLLSRGADINAQISYTALQGATAFGHTNVARLLIKRGADVNVSSEEYGSALEAAVAGGTDKHSSAVIRLLLDHGAIPAVQTIKIGRTPWITAHESRVRANRVTYFWIMALIELFRQHFLARLSRQHRSMGIERWLSSS
jgi:ankyrin repeat protein